MVVNQNANNSFFKLATKPGPQLKNELLKFEYHSFGYALTISSLWKSSVVCCPKELKYSIKNYIPRWNNAIVFNKHGSRQRTADVSCKLEILARKKDSVTLYENEIFCPTFRPLEIRTVFHAMKIFIERKR